MVSQSLSAITSQLTQLVRLMSLSLCLLKPIPAGILLATSSLCIFAMTPECLEELQACFVQAPSHCLMGLSKLPHPRWSLGPVE